MLLPLALLLAPQAPQVTQVEVAAGVYLFQTAPYGDAGLDGNSVAIVGDDGVLVFDANGTPAAAEAVLARIRALTPKPVRYLVLSHWHWDHWYGAEVYQRAFPGIEIVSHEATRRLMSGPALAFNQPGLDQQLPAHIREVEAGIAGSPDSAALREHAARDRWFLSQKQGVRHTVATRTFTDSLTLRLGSRVIQVLHHDRAITPGDAFLYLPAERMVVAGDLLINPLTFALFCYPAGWIATLKRLDAIDPVVIIPGHGAPFRDKTHLQATLALLQREVAIATPLKQAGRPLADAQAAVLADSTVLALRARLTGGVAAREPAFALYMVEWFLKRLYQEFDGPLDDSIPASP